MTAFKAGNKYIVATPAVLEDLRSARDSAVAQGKDTFLFHGHELLVDYAKYLIQYLDNQFNGKEIV